MQISHVGSERGAHLSGHNGNPSSIKAVIFDLGNVLVDFDHMLAAGKISLFTKRSPQEIHNLFFDSELTGAFEEGRISPHDFYLQVKELLDLRLEFEEFVPIWNEIFFLSEKNIQVYKLAQALKNRYKLALLTNINILHLEYIRQKLPVFRPFSHIIASCGMGMRKPNPLLYQSALDRLGVPALAAFYTDDRMDLIEKARGLGIQSFQFQGIDKLKADLFSLGIDIRSLK